MGMGDRESIMEWLPIPDFQKEKLIPYDSERRKVEAGAYSDTTIFIASIFLESSFKTDYPQSMRSSIISPIIR